VAATQNQKKRMKKNIWQIRLVVTMFIVSCQSRIGTFHGSGLNQA